MKTFLKSGMGLCLMVVILFTAMAILSYFADVFACQVFFGICAFTFLMMMPACSTKE